MSDSTLPLAVHGDTHVGLVHHKNEDSYTIADMPDGGKLLLVCDGMGGMGKGDEASQLALKLLVEELTKNDAPPPERMKRAITKADVGVREALCNQGDGLPGSTAVMIYVLEGYGHVCWVGDSRAYLVRNGELVERTRDHKLVEELVRAGELTEEEAKVSTLAHVVTRALGGRSTREPPIPASLLHNAWNLQTGDIVVVCSDGVCDLVDDAEVAEFVTDCTPEEAVKTLIEVVLQRGAHDNTTVIVGIWEGPDTPEIEEDAKETPMFAPPRVLGDEEDTAAGDRTWDDLAKVEDEEDDTQVTLVPGKEIEELVQQVRTASPQEQAAPEPAAAENDAEGLKVVATIGVAAAVVLGLVYLARLLLG